MNVSIIGLGLIGGSLGLALRESSIDVVVSGWDRDLAAITAALERGAIDRPVFTLPEAIRESDLVVVATPVIAVQAIFAQIAADLKWGAIVTDVSSTKAQVTTWAKQLLPPHVSFIGGHPMAGSERHGVLNARADLFHNAVYCLTPDEQATPDALVTLESLAVSIGARPLCLSASDHDAYVAAVSHLPFLLSSALAQITTQDPQWPEMSALAAMGYRDLTRLASGDPVMHRDICLTNADAIQPWLRNMAAFLNTLADQLDDAQDLHALFASAKQGRDDWLHQQRSTEEAHSPGETRVPDPAVSA